MANKIKQIKLGQETYIIFDEEATQLAGAAQEAATKKVATINGHSYDDINNGTVTFADTPIETADIDAAIDAITNSTQGD